MTDLSNTSINEPIVQEDHQLIGDVREGMTVIDRNGEEVGKVKSIKMGDPSAATVSEAELPQTDVLHDVPLAAAPSTNATSGVIAAPVAPLAIDDLDSPETNDERLLRAGYLRVDAKGWFKSDLLVPANAISSVSGDTVTISLAKDDLEKA